MSDLGKLILPNPAKVAEPADTLDDVKTKYNNLVKEFNSLISALRIAKTGV